MFLDEGWGGLTDLWPPLDHYGSPTSLCTRRAARCKSAAGNFWARAQHFGTVVYIYILKKPLTLTLFPSIKNLPDSWDGCRIFAVHWSPRATWAVQCQAGCWRAARHTRVQLLDCHITTDYLGGLLTVYAAN